MLNVTIYLIGFTISEELPGQILSQNITYKTDVLIILILGKYIVYNI